MPNPPHPAIGTVNIEIYGPGEGHSRWDIALWGDAAADWSDTDWRDVTPQSLIAQASGGADDTSAGIMAVAAAGTWNVNTYDPDRILDPSNTESYLQSVLRPGSKVRIRYNGIETRTVASGIIDTITYDVQTERGSIRATGGTSRLVAARAAAATPMAETTLRAITRQLLTLYPLSGITVEDDPDEGDITVGTPPTDALSLWDYINTIAFDVLHAVWLDRDDVIRFRSFGDPRDLGLQLGGVDGIPLTDVAPESSLAGVYSRVVAYDVSAPSTPVSATDAGTKSWAGDVPYERTRPVPNASTWVANVLTDRAGAALQYKLGRILPRDETEVLALLDTEMVDVAHVNVTHRNEGRETLATPIEVAPRVLGWAVTADTITGWSFALSAYVTNAEWTDNVVIEPEPPEPPAYQTVVRTYVVNKDSRALYLGGSNLGSGTEHELPVGYWSGGKNRSYLGFATIPWTDVLEVVSAELRIYTSDQVNIGFGSSPKVRIQRITQTWSEGTQASPSGSNALKWPGPNRTSTGEYTPNVTGSENTLQIFDVSRLVRAWAPVAAGGSAAGQYGLAIISYAESTASRTTEFYSREEGSSWDAEIRVTVKIPA